MKNSYESQSVKKIAAATILALGAGALAGCQISEDVNKTFYFKAVCDDKKAEPIIDHIVQRDLFTHDTASVWVTCEGTDPKNDLAISTTPLRDESKANVSIDITYKQGFLQGDAPIVDTFGPIISFDNGTITSAQIIE